MAALTGKQLSEKYRLEVQQSRYREDGKWYHNPTDFPCAFHDEDGYLIVTDLTHWETLKTQPTLEDPYVKQTKSTHIREPGISVIRGYVRHTPQPVYTIQNIIDEGCFLSEARLIEILNCLKVNQNIILQGPPGTGKTWLAKRLAYALVGSKSARQVRPFQFHPNMSYEDFVRGWRPTGNATLELMDGPFILAICEAAENLTRPYVVVIEEINRGNPAQIFGEMLTLIEADKRIPEEALALCYPKEPKERVYIPPNLYTIGTMNLADRSLALVDFAFRRRFAFIDLEPELGEPWRIWVRKKTGIPEDFLTNIASRIGALNQTISNDAAQGPQFQVGHSVVTPRPETTIPDHKEWFTQVVRTQIGAHLEEIWFDDRDRARSERDKLLQGLL